GRVLVHNTGHLNFSRCVACHGGQENTAQGVAQRVAITTLEGFHHDACVILANGLDFNRTGFQKTLRRHVCSFSIPSARYTDKADGQTGEPAKKNRKAHFPAKAEEVGGLRHYSNTAISASRARQPSIR